MEVASRMIEHEGLFESVKGNEEYNRAMSNFRKRREFAQHVGITRLLHSHTA